MRVSKLHIDHMIGMSTICFWLWAFIIGEPEELNGPPIITYDTESFVITSVYSIDMGFVRYSTKDTLYGPSEMGSVCSPLLILQLATSIRVMGDLPGLINVPV